MLKTSMNPTRSCSDHCAAGSIEEKDAMRVWLELKQNGFLSPSPLPLSASKPRPAPMPNKKRERHRNAGFSEKPELAKVRRVDGLTKVAVSASGLLKKINPGTTPSVGMLPTPKKHSEMRRIGGPKGFLKVLKVEPTNMYSRISPPCGLLNEFNPGIINRIRSSKQVFSVIRDFVRRDTLENIDIPSKQEKRSGENDVIGCPNSSSGSDQLGLCSKGPSDHLCVKTEYDEEVGDLGIAVRRDKDELKSSLSSVIASENASSSVLDEVSASTARGSSLSLEDATAASQWLQCLHHDITWRLEASMRGRTRIQNAIQRELPALMLKEFSDDQETDFLAAKRFVSLNMDVHKAKWINQFDRMDKTPNEEVDRLVVYKTLTSGHQILLFFFCSVEVVTHYSVRALKFVHGVLVNLVLSFLVSTHGFVGAKTADSDKTDLKANLIITDYCMRGMTGYELLKRIKESPTMKEIPVVVVSSENIPT
ncbi:hypothetical protein NC652_031964 [Populus alba x Populus x berolinensis]|nr:hypothetical protein NC652_031964 [Populus alba x Populus x berolinensis]